MALLFEAKPKQDMDIVLNINDHTFITRKSGALPDLLTFSLIGRTGDQRRRPM